MSRAMPTLILALLLGAVGCLVSGIGMLFGAGWALVSAAPCLAALSFIFARGLRNG